MCEGSGTDMWAQPPSTGSLRNTSTGTVWSAIGTWMGCEVKIEWLQCLERKQSGEGNWCQRYFKAIVQRGTRTARDKAIMICSLLTQPYLFLWCRYREQILVNFFSFVYPACGMLGSRDLVEMLTTFYLRSMSSTTSHFGHILLDNHHIYFQIGILSIPPFPFFLGNQLLLLWLLLLLFLVAQWLRQNCRCCSNLSTLAICGTCH